MAPASLLCLAIAVASAAYTSGCGGGKLQKDAGSGTINIGGSGPGLGLGGAGGFEPPPAACPPSDPALVIAPQRTLLLSSLELVNMIRALTDDTEARAIVDASVFPVLSDLQMRFPPALTEQYKRILDEDSMRPFTAVAMHAAKYVLENFAAMTGCAPATDACAQTYLGDFAARAFRRPLDDAEQSDLAARYQTARNTTTTEAAAHDVVAAILVAPQFLYRSEMGDPSRASSSPPGVPLTPYELASALSFFLNNGPPDQPLLDDAVAGTLPATLGAHVDRLLAMPPARAWLTKVIEALYRLNLLPATTIDSGKFPFVNAGLYADLQMEAHLFLADTLWNATLVDLVTSRKTFLSSNLATMVYGVPVPDGATSTTFAPAMLPPDQRSGILTNAGFLTTFSYSVGVDVMRRGIGISFLMTAHSLPWTFVGSHITQEEYERSLSEPARQQAEERSSRPECNSCHLHSDPYAVALDSYDVVGRFRTVGDMGEKIDTHTTLPPELAGTPVANATELAAVIAHSAAFKNTMAMNMLDYALVDRYAEVPDPSAGAAGCAVADVARRFDADPDKTFSSLLRAVVLSPAFSLRSPAPAP